MKISSIKAREILDSRGWPTVECIIELDKGQFVVASVPSGASVGKYEAVELRDRNLSRYKGKGVLQAIENIEKRIKPALIGKTPDLRVCDSIMLELDGTENKSNLGANAILPVSIAIVRAQALCEKKAVYELIQGLSKSVESKLPFAMFNIINGGMHADNGISFQEFMIMPVVGKRFADLLHVSVLVYQELKAILHKAGYVTGIGDEGGFAPRLQKNKQSQERQVLDLLCQATEVAGFEPGKDVLFTLDVAASQLYKDDGTYLVNSEKLSAEGLIDEYKKLIADYPIYSIEDGLDEDDWKGWKLLTEDIGKRIQLVGDDIFVSNSKRVTEGISQHIANAVLIKPNQIGTVSETLDAIALAQKHDYRVVVSHRSGETNDDFIADLAVGAGVGQFKAGAPVRGERLAKYNRLLAIEEKLIVDNKHKISTL